MPTKYAPGFISLNEETQLADLEVRGEIPAWLTGSLVRTAPAKFETERKPLNHWFDGYAMLHQFDFDDGKVSYQNRFVQSDAYRGMRTKGKMTKTEFATDPCKAIFGHLFSLFQSPQPTDNPNVNTGKIGDKLVTMTETPMPIVFDQESLTTQGHLDFEDNLQGLLTVAHPHFDQAQNMYSYLLKFGYESEYQVYKLPYKSKKREVIASVPSKTPAYVHSFGYTDNYIILAEFAFVVNPLKLKFSGKPLIANYEWKPELGTRFHVIDKKQGGLIKTLTAPPIFCFHHVNAYEEENSIVVDLIAFSDAKVIENFYLDNLRNGPANAAGKLTRYRINLEREKINVEQLSNSSMGLPRINYDFNGQPYGRLYAAGNKVSGNFYDALITRDMTSGEERWWVEENTYPGEAVYVPHPQASEEVNGVVLSIVFNADSATSFLLILDASSYDEIARANLPQHIPFGFHGNYFS